MDAALLEQMYRASNNYDEAWALAQEEFSDGSLEERKFRRKYRRRPNEEKSALGAANNAATYRDLLQEGSPEDADRLLGKLKEGETILRMMNVTLSLIDLDWSDLCREHQKLLGPSRVEEIVRAQQGVQNTRGKKYLDAQAVAFVTPGEPNYAWCSITDQSISYRVRNDTQGTDITVGEFDAAIETGVSGPKKLVYNMIKSTFALQSIKKWAVLELPRKAVPFFNLRYFMSRVGGRVHDETSIREHRMQWHAFRD
ncbi:hypothetical protein CMO91_02185 [Candidatus Woesearchaeota archaeon]|nr:hypothetical protein [Candidatus Woesearchaeota archaeon]